MLLLSEISNLSLIFSILLQVYYNLIIVIIITVRLLNSVYFMIIILYAVNLEVCMRQNFLAPTPTW